MTTTPLIDDSSYHENVQGRHRRGSIFQAFYMGALVIAILVLIILLISVIDRAFGLVVQTYAVEPQELAEQPLDELDTAALADILVERVPRRLLVLTRENLRAVEPEQFTRVPLATAIRGEVPAEYADLNITQIENEQIGEILALNLSEEQLIELIDQEILQPTIRQSWSLLTSIFNRAEIDEFYQTRFPEGELVWESWLDLTFLTTSLSSTPGETGIRPALIGSIWLMLITALVAFPLGVGAAIYLQEYAEDTWYNRIIETNIRNLAGVPSIIYGMLGLAIFVRALDPITSGRIFGDGNANGRTIISAGLTLALLVLPIIIVNAQEALRSVSNAIREASYGLGATRWQTISRQVLPAAIPGIMTGTILALSRAVGETAPLVVVGAAAFISSDPSGPFSSFTALPMLIYNWTRDPNPQFRNTAGATIIVLLALLLTMNSIAIILRNRASKRI